MFLKAFAMDSAVYFEMKEGCKCSFVEMFFSWVTRKSVLFEIIQTSLTVKNNENMVKNGVSKSVCDGELIIFFEMKEGWKVSCVKNFF